MVVKNIKDSDHAGFIANGDIIESMDFQYQELYGFKFANVKIEWSIIRSKAFETVLLWIP
jgi:hypothetical protein